MAMIDSSDITVDFYRLEDNIAIGNVSIFRGMIRFDSTVHFDIDTYQTTFLNEASFDMLPENYQKVVRGSVMGKANLFLRDQGIKTPFD